ncbi:MAG: CBS domain-containing protein [Planctomycetes bacterium]|nr:CBS domain-containing protein [Planctomycetota bacterium]
MLEAKTIMKTNLITVKKETPIYDAIELISKNKITGLPVVNDDMALVGVVSEKDVLHLLNDLDSLMLVDELKGSVATVNDFMTQKVVSFDEDDDLFDICDVLIENNFRRVPITSKGKLVGIITRADIVAYILQLKCKDKQNAAL